MSELHYTYYESPVGLLRIGGTEQYIGELGFVDNSDQLTYGEPGITEVMHQCTEQLIEYFHGTRRNFDIPIHQEGTEFQTYDCEKIVDKMMIGETHSEKVPELSFQYLLPFKVSFKDDTELRSLCTSLIGLMRDYLIRTGRRGGFGSSTKTIMNSEEGPEEGQLLFFP